MFKVSCPEAFPSPFVVITELSTPTIAFCPQGLQTWFTGCEKVQAPTDDKYESMYLIKQLTIGSRSVDGSASVTLG